MLDQQARKWSKLRDHFGTQFMAGRSLALNARLHDAVGIQHGHHVGASERVRLFRNALKRQPVHMLPAVADLQAGHVPMRIANEAVCMMRLGECVD